MILTPTEARCLGVFEDAAEAAGFLYARHQAALGGGVLRTGGGHPDASIFFVSASYPVRPNVLVRIEEPFIALIGGTDSASGFGDAVMRARLDLLEGGVGTLRLMSSLRLGTGSTELFPYASQSIDLSIGIGWVDSVCTPGLWARVDGVSVFRAPKGLDEDTRHDNSIRVGAGAGCDIAGHVGLHGGAFVSKYVGGGTRGVVFGQVGYRHTPALELYAGANVEVGTREYRVDDLSLTAGLHTWF